MIDGLLDLAFKLARGVAAGRPNPIELRRAASSAYYAVFHALCTMCAGQLVGQKPWTFFTPVYKALGHRMARNVLNDLRKSDPETPICTIALTFVRLQNARHEADYSPEPFSLNRSGTVESIEAPQEAADLLSTLSPDQELMLAIRLFTGRRQLNPVTS